MINWTRFWSYVKKGNGCWLWQGYVNPVTGYGQCSSVYTKSRKAHRAAWIYSHGFIPRGKQVLHNCDNKPCVRHLFLGTHQDNMNDMRRKGRSNYPQGSRVGTAKLREADIFRIRGLSNKGMSIKSISLKFGVTPSNISYIIRRKTWRHVK